MIMRRRPAAPRTSLLGTMARTAVVVGTANAVTNKMNKPAAAAQPQAAPAAPPEMMFAAAPAAPAAGGITPEKLEMLKNLGELKAQGILSEVEFAVEKTKLLAS